MISGVFGRRCRFVVRQKRHTTWPRTQSARTEKTLSSNSRNKRGRRHFVALFFSLATALLASAVVRAEFVAGTVRNDPRFRENAPAAVFPNTTIAPQWPLPAPQTHALDLSRHDEATSRAYFKWLCDNEAGEFIYKTVEGVESVFTMRRRVGFDRDFRFRDRYYLEDPWGAIPWDTGLEDLGEANPSGFLMANDYRNFKGWSEHGDYFQYFPGYMTLERVAAPLENQRYGPGPYIRYTRVWPTHPDYDHGPDGQVRMFQQRKYLNAPPKETVTAPLWWEKARLSANKEEHEAALRAVGFVPAMGETVNKIQSRYGWTWRGIERSQHDRPLGIGGGEVIVFDLQTNEVLAYRRNFRRTVAGSGDVDWTTGRQCLKFENMALFVKVLKQRDPFRGIQVHDRTKPNPNSKKH
jgi:hypothetical protein